MQLSHRTWASILIGILAGNAIGLALYLSFDKPKPASPETADVDTTSLSYRSKGLDAIEHGDHEAAIKAFSAGLRTPNPAPDLPQLLSIAQNMRQKALERTEAEAAAAADVTTTDKSASGQAAERTAEPSPPPQPQPALLLVTSQPDQLPVEVDGTVRELSPARIEVKPGRHKVALLRGRERIYEKTVRVKAGDVKLVDADLTDVFLPKVPPPSLPIAAARPAPATPRTALDGQDLGGSAARSPAAGASGPAAGQATGVATAPGGSDAVAAGPDPRRAVGSAQLNPRGAAAAAVGGDGAAYPTASGNPSPATTMAVPSRRSPSNDRRSTSKGRRRRPPAQKGIPVEEVRKVVADSQQHFQQCYDRFRRVRRTLAGRVVIEADVGADGRVDDPGRITTSTMQGSGINDCLGRAARRLQFAPPKGGPTKVRFALRFEPPK